MSFVPQSLKLCGNGYYRVSLDLSSEDSDYRVVHVVPPPHKMIVIDA